MKDSTAAILFFLGAALIFACGAKFAVSAKNAEWESRLVKSGHAEYYLDANNERQWRMKEAK